MTVLGSLIAYSFRTVVCTVDSRPIMGFWDGDDAITIEDAADAATPLIGADGSVIVSSSASLGANITLRLMSNSPGNAILAAKLSQLKAGIPAAFAFSVRDLTTGEGGAGPCFVTKSSNLQYGVTASVREWTLFCSPFIRTNPVYTVV